MSPDPRPDPRPEEQARRRLEQIAAAVVEPVRRYLRRRTDPATADDVLGETLLVLWRRLDDVPTDEPVPWAIGVARLQLANATRTARRQDRVSAKETVHAHTTQTVEDPAGSITDRVLVDQALAALRPVDAELLRLWAWEDLDARAIATVLDITPGAVAVRLHRARAKLRAELESRGAGPDMTQQTKEDR